MSIYITMHVIHDISYIHVSSNKIIYLHDCEHHLLHCNPLPALFNPNRSSLSQLSTDPMRGEPTCCAPSNAPGFGSAFSVSWVGHQFHCENSSLQHKIVNKSWSRKNMCFALKTASLTYCRMNICICFIHIHKCVMLH